MNGAQQRQHRRATDTLAQVITETQGAVVERFEEMEASFAAMHEKVTGLVGYVDSQDRELARALAALQEQVRMLKATQFDEPTTCWNRLRWVVTGR